MGTSPRTAPRRSWTPLRRDVAGLLGTDADGRRVRRERDGGPGRPGAGLAARTEARACSSRRRSGVPTWSCWSATGWSPSRSRPMPTGWSTWRRSPVGSGRPPPDVVLVDQVSAHRGLVQPAAEIIELAREHGVPVWLDAAQSVGPRRRTAWCRRRRRDQPQVADRPPWRRDGRRGRAAPPPPARTTTREAARRPDHPDARVAGGPRRGTGRARGRRTRAPRPRTRRRRRAPLRRGPCRARDGRHRGRLGGRPPGRTCRRDHLPATDAGSGHRAGPRARCSTSTTSSPASCLPWRAPGERIDEPWLRLSPHVDLTDDDLERTAAALSGGVSP